MFKLKHLIILASFAYIIVIGGGALGYRYFIALPELKTNADLLVQYQIQHAQNALLRQEDGLLKSLASTDFSHSGHVKSGKTSWFFYQGQPQGYEAHLETLNGLGHISTEAMDEFITLANQQSKSRVSYLNLDDNLYQLGIIKNNLGIRFGISEINTQWAQQLDLEQKNQLTLHHFQEVSDQIRPNHIALLDSQGDVTGYLSVHHLQTAPPIIDKQTAVGILSLLSLPIIITALVVIIFVAPMLHLIASIKNMSSNNQPRKISTGFYIYELGALTEAFNELLFKLGRQHELLKHETLTDQLTGIANRRAFDQTLEHDWRFSLRTKLPFTVIIADIDHFKNYNDFYGHQAGDQALSAVALALRACCRRATEFVSRYGGEEFGLILQGDEDAASFLASINESVSSLGIPHAHSSCAEVLTISIGACSFQPTIEDEHADSSQLEAILKQADKALYESKESGRNRFTHVTYRPMAN